MTPKPLATERDGARRSEICLYLACLPSVAASAEEGILYLMLKYRKIYFIFSSILVLASIVSLSFWRLNLSLEFTGGSLIDIEFKNVERPDNQAIHENIEKLDLGNITIQPKGENGLVLRFKHIGEESHQKILNILRENFAKEQDQEIEEKRFESIGPIIGAELKNKAIWAIAIVVVAIILYVAWAFRKISSKRISSWKYGIVAVVALLHDIIITLGIFSVLGHFLGIEIGIAFIAGLLTILGYSVNDTIVVFDRVRENLLGFSEDEFEHTVDLSVKQTIRRSVNTSLTSLAVLIAIFLFGGETIRYFILCLIIGVILGTYSSIFLASPFLISWEKWRFRKREE